MPAPPPPPTPEQRAFFAAWSEEDNRKRIHYLSLCYASPPKEGADDLRQYAFERIWKSVTLYAIGANVVHVVENVLRHRRTDRIRSGEARWASSETEVTGDEAAPGSDRSPERLAMDKQQHELFDRLYQDALESFGTSATGLRARRALAILLERDTDTEISMKELDATKTQVYEANRAAKDAFRAAYERHQKREAAT